MRENYDCVVVGGGPGGCSAAILLAKSGLSVLLVEREAVPRFHVGESLMPETYWVFERLGLLEKMRSSDFIKKESVQFVSSRGRESAPFFFKEHDPRECSQTWQVERDKFDEMLFLHAQEKGADCYDQTRVQEVYFDEKEDSKEVVKGVLVKQKGKDPRRITTKVVVDATGQSAFLANRFKLKVDNPELRNGAIWSYFRGAVRDEGANGGATIILHTTDKDSWFWFIPLSDDITSIGVVGEIDYLTKREGSPEEVFYEELEKCSNLKERLTNTEVVDRFRLTKEFSYTTTKHAGDGWVLVGDAFGFLDPVYSSGVYFALKMGEMAADAIIEGFEKNDLSGMQLGRWVDEFKGGMHWTKKLVDVFYNTDFSFGKFMKEHSEHRSNLTDLLIGRAFHNRAGAIFTDLDKWLVEQKCQKQSMDT
ncbi:MAG: tryptophan 7-halogenase [Pirellulaceae bacterium]|nr:tryptophan 7-halogenase [Pirellulaceae bacterium]